MKKRLAILGLMMSALMLCSAAWAQDVPSVTVAPVETVKVVAGHTVSVPIDFRVSKGFHINSNKPHSELLIATEMKFSLPTELMIAGVDYPAGSDLVLPFMPNEPLSVYSGDQEVTAKLRPAKNAAGGTFRVHAQLKYQACNDRQCFPPHITPVDFDVKVTKASRRKR